MHKHLLVVRIVVRLWRIQKIDRFHCRNAAVTSETTVLPFQQGAAHRNTVYQCQANT